MPTLADTPGPRLRRPRDEVNRRLRERIDLGRQLLSRMVISEADLDDVYADLSVWGMVNLELLRALFENSATLRWEYATVPIWSPSVNPTVAERWAAMRDKGIKEQLVHLETIRARVEFYSEVPSQTVAPVGAVHVPLSFDFISDPKLRDLLVADYAEAYTAFAADAAKAAAIMAASVIEGMFLEVLQRPSLTRRPEYETAVRPLKKGGTAINWDRAGLVGLVDAAVALKLLDQQAAHLGRAVADYRDTVHPQNELMKGGGRARREEARVLLQFIPLIYRDLAVI